MIYNKTKLNKKSAFSLVEVLISLVLISLVMVAMAPVITKKYPIKQMMAWFLLTIKKIIPQKIMFVI